MSGGTVILEVRVNKGICSVGENGKLAASGPDIRACLKHAVRDKPADAPVCVNFISGSIYPDLPPNAKCRDIGAL
jgi:hypothetical protein